MRVACGRCNAAPGEGLNDEPVQNGDEVGRRDRRWRPHPHSTTGRMRGFGVDNVRGCERHDGEAVTEAALPVASHHRGRCERLHTGPIPALCRRGNPRPVGPLFRLLSNKTARLMRQAGLALPLASAGCRLTGLRTRAAATAAGRQRKAQAEKFDPAVGASAVIVRKTRHHRHRGSDQSESSPHSSLQAAHLRPSIWPA
jgi:hypothetical protein